MSCFFFKPWHQNVGLQHSLSAPVLYHNTLVAEWPFLTLYSFTIHHSISILGDSQCNAHFKMVLSSTLTKHLKRIWDLWITLQQACYHHSPFLHTVISLSTFPWPSRTGGHVIHPTNRFLIFIQQLLCWEHKNKMSHNLKCSKIKRKKWKIFVLETK